MRIRWLPGLLVAPFARSTRSLKMALAAATAVTLMAASPPCQAADPEEIYQSALADMSAGNFESACARFAEARRMKPDSTAALQGLALCNDKLGKTASAWARYRELTMELKAKGDADRSQAAANRADELSRGLSTVVVKLESPDTAGLMIRLDRDEVPRVMFGTKMNVDPGSHILQATAPGYEVWQTTFSVLGKGDAREIHVPALVAKPSATAAGSAWSALRITGVTVAGVGVVGLVVGAVFGAQAISKNNASKAQCSPTDPNLCNDQGVSLRGDAKTAGTVSTAALIAGGVLAAGGVVLAVTTPAAKLEVAPQTAGVVLRGRW
jgi:hypothetical protein